MRLQECSDMALPALERKPFKRHERLHCTNCNRVIDIRQHDGKFSHFSAFKKHCYVCEGLFASVIASAHLKIKKLIESGSMESPKGKSCVDCGAPAVCHDLRNYSKPIEAVPVCRSCNTLRGPGILGEIYAVRTIVPFYGPCKTYSPKMRPVQ